MKGRKTHQSEGLTRLNRVRQDRSRASVHALTESIVEYEQGSDDVQIRALKVAKDARKPVSMRSARANSG